MPVLSRYRERPRPAHHLMRAFAVAALAALLAPILPAAAVTVEVPVTHIRVASAQMGSSQRVSLGINKSFIVDLPADASEVIVSQPDVAVAIMRSKTRAIVQGTGAGDTNIFFLDSSGRTIFVVDIQVFQPRSDVGSALEAALRRIIPGSSIQVDSVVLMDNLNRIVLSGTVLSQDDIQRAIDVATQFAGSRDNVASIINVGGGQQVMLKVTVAEVQRETVKQLGINLSATLNVGSLTTGLISSPSLGGASSVVGANTITAGVDIGGFSLDATLRALERRGALRTLAEPTLTAISGQAAEFLAGGEFPVPTGIDDKGAVTITFKEFGVKLNFTPTVKSNGSIVLAVDTAVSELTTEGGFTAGGITIPATRNRKAKTTVEMQPGMTLAIAGLMEEKVRQQFNSMPGIGDIPIIGALFRSRDFIHSQTELVILVTPYIAEAVHNPGPLPTDDLQFAGDAEAIFLGHMEKMYGVGDPIGSMRGGYDGSIGFVLD